MVNFVIEIKFRKFLKRFVIEQSFSKINITFLVLILCIYSIILLKHFFLSKQIKQIGKVALRVIQIVIKIDHISAICHCFYIRLHEIQRTKYIVCQK